MGDRANVVIKNPNETQIVLYTHWDGASLPATVHRALSRKQRWNDETYLARIIFSEMIKDDIGSETGFGISTDINDGGDQVIEIDTQAQTVTVGDNKAVSFGEFIASKPHW